MIDKCLLTISLTLGTSGWYVMTKGVAVSVDFSLILFLSLESTLFRNDSPAVCFSSCLIPSMILFKFRKSAENWPSNNCHNVDRCIRENAFNMFVKP